LNLSLLTAIAICVVSAAIEGLCAGTGVKSFFATLRTPKYSASLPVWYVIGVGYYLTFGFILYRLLMLPPNQLVQIALALVVVMMVANALWNLIFFRARNLYIAFVTVSAAPVPDVLLFISLWRLDPLAALALIPYLTYRAYAVWWGYALWVVNR
jgi:tryptophan-rich sensory protein